MSKLKKVGHRIDADYTEDVVAIMLEAFFAILTAPYYQFSIEPFSKPRERLLGADARLYDGYQRFMPFYMQFKRPSSYPDFSNSKIITDRKSSGLSVSPGALFFNLRDKAIAHPDYQHNVLFRLRRALRKLNLGDAAYVCPLFLNRLTYTATCRQAAYDHWNRRFHDPWFWERVLIRDHTGLIRFNEVPTIREHVSIPPHATVTHAKHSYSFTDRGREVCFHSPKSLPDSGVILSKWLTAMSEEFVHGEKQYVREAQKEHLGEIIRELGDAIPNDSIDKTSEVSSWLSFGDFLERQYGISQYAFIAW